MDHAETQALRPFELKIIEDYRRMGHGTCSKGLWIREHLKLMLRDYPYSMYKKWRAFCESAAEVGVSIKAGTYQAFRTYFYLLTRLRLVLKERTLTGEKGRRVAMYRLNPERILDPRWLRPFQWLYPVTDWKRKTDAERRALRKKYKPPGRPRRGRPPKYVLEEAAKKAEQEWRRRAKRLIRG
jgi:hypothetical protein